MADGDAKASKSGVAVGSCCDFRHVFVGKFLGGQKKQRIEKKISDGGFLEVSSNILMKIQDLGILLYNLTWENAKGYIRNGRCWLE